ncbi:threonine aldolase [Clostridiales bacterium PH28_bin88]|nr:threonine aldolase [Clostridiales bacterium PH28_bin88]
MREAMGQAEVGDDVYGEDVTVSRLEAVAAEKMGKEAGLLVASGTMGNLVALLTHTHRGEEVLVEAEAHIYYYEVGGMAALAGVMPRLLRSEKGVVTTGHLREALRPADLHLPRTTLLCLENTHNRAGGTVASVQQMREVTSLAREYGLRVHLDGARIFNAAVALGVPASELAKEADSVQFCLSKGLAAPVGSLLVGDKEWIDQARKWRKTVGGGMRQAGVIAAAGLVALESMVDRLAEDHRLARVLAEGLAGMPGILIDMGTVQTNIVVFDVSGTGMAAPAFVTALKERGVKCNAFSPNTVRMVTHKDVDEGDIQRTLEIVREMLRC